MWEESAATAVSLRRDNLMAGYSNEAGFRQWCNSTVFDRLASLLNDLLNQSERTPFYSDVLGR